MIEGLLVVLFIVGLAGGFGMVRSQRSRKAKLTSHPTRVRIMDHLRSNPGTSITDLCEQTDAKWGTLQHHLHLMSQAGLVRSVSGGRNRRLFLGKDDIPRDDMQRIALLRRGKVMTLVATVLRNPGAIQKEVTRSAALSRKVFRMYANLLLEQGLIKEKVHARARRYYPTPQLKRLVRRMGAPGLEAAETAAALTGRVAGSVAADDSGPAMARLE